MMICTPFVFLSVSCMRHTSMITEEILHIKRLKCLTHLVSLREKQLSRFTIKCSAVALIIPLNHTKFGSAV